MERLSHTDRIRHRDCKSRDAIIADYYHARRVGRTTPRMIAAIEESAPPTIVISSVWPPTLLTAVTQHHAWKKYIAIMIILRNDLSSPMPVTGV
jgi:hypothetical protein